MSTYEELCHLLYEFKQMDDAQDDVAMFKTAMQIRDAASRLVVEAANILRPDVDPQHLRMGMQ